MEGSEEQESEPRGSLPRTRADRSGRPPQTPPRRQRRSPATVQRRLRPRGTGGVIAVREGVWRIDVEAPRDPETGRRRRSSRFVYGTREEAELALAQLRVAAHQRRLPTGKSRPRSVRKVLEAYVAEAEAGRIELSPSTVVTSRSASNTMARTRLSDGTLFGDLRLSQLTWERVEDLYGSMRSSGRGADWVRRCATVLSRALEQARKRGVIESNPCRDATRPKSVRSRAGRARQENHRAVAQCSDHRSAGSSVPRLSGRARGPAHRRKRGRDSSANPVPRHLGPDDGALRRPLGTCHSLRRLAARS